jgi:ribonuclease HI
VGLNIHVDGGSRGNPGPAGAGVVIRDEGGRLIYEAGYFLGRQTNNEAEYHALIRALERAGRRGNDAVAIHSDSELLVRQLTGDYQVKSARLAPLYHQVQVLLVRTARWSVRHVRREQNTRADELANLAMDKRRDVVVFDVDAPGVAVGDALDAPDPSPAGCVLDAPPAPAASAAPVSAGGQAVRVSLARPPKAGGCPAGGCPQAPFTIESTLPVGLCIYAAHALLPTALAMLHTDAAEFAAVPTLTIRCTRPGCNAEFNVSPVHGPNGTHRS